MQELNFMQFKAAISITWIFFPWLKVNIGS